MDIETRQKIERQIVDRVIDLAIAGGYALRVWDGEGWGCERTTDAVVVKAAMFACDEESLAVYVQEDGEPKWKREGWINFVYGNDGYDVISDNTSNPRIDAIASAAMELAERLEKQHG